MEILYFSHTFLTENYRKGLLFSFMCCMLNANIFFNVEKKKNSCLVCYVHIIKNNGKNKYTCSGICWLSSHFVISIFAQCRMLLVV